MTQYEKLVETYPVLKPVQEGKEVVWINPDKMPYESCKDRQELTMADIDGAEERLDRFAPFLMKCFPETAESGGLIESELREIPDMQKRLNQKYASQLPGRLFLKMDSHLPIAGSVKARGGIYEVLKHTEDLVQENHLLQPGESYERLAEDDCRRFFADYTVQVGSTGNLGMSIGIMSAAIGYKAVVHMSADAKQWKKDTLRSHGVTVIEYASDYSEAVNKGRALSDQNPKSYFVDDENSKNLFLGYAVAAKRLRHQLEEQKIQVNREHPLFVYLPCGVGGAPGGICFGLKQVFGDDVHCFFVEPVQAPCMLIGMATGLHNQISVQDLGLSGQTEADGLAVGRPSGFVGRVMKPLLSGEFTVQDAKLYEYMRDLLETENIFLEPSACAAFQGPVCLMKNAESRRYLGGGVGAGQSEIPLNDNKSLAEKMPDAVHIAWATGGRMVPEDVREEYRNTYLE